MFDYILLLLLSLSPAYVDNESWEERTARMTVIAKAIDNAGDWATCSGKYVATEERSCKVQWSGTKKQLALFLVTKGWWESRFAKNVHEGKCKPYECDPHKDKKGNITHRARTSWQMQFTSFVRDNEWKEMVGVDQRATNIAAYVAARILSRARDRCKTDYGTMSGYAGNMGCTWEGVKNRVAFLSKLKDKSEDDLRKDAERERKKLEDRIKPKVEVKP
jgi:hypothetical protein